MTVYAEGPMSVPARPPLYDTCTNCLTPNAVLMPDRTYGEGHYCPTCTRKQALHDAATRQLELLVEDAVVAWASVWQDEFKTLDLEEYLAQIALNIKERVKRGEFGL